MECTKEKTKMKMLKRILIYLLGLLIIAVGINFSKMSGLGISPVSSIPRALEVALGFSLGTMVIVIYIILVLLQLLVLRKKFKLKNILGVPVAIIFGWMVDLVGIDPNAFGHLLVNFPKPVGYPMQFLYLIASILIIGIGVTIYLRPNLVPMPAEGLAAAISEVTGKPFGDCKTMVDVGLIVIALLIQLIFLGGFSSFTGDTVVVREGTIISAICVGQVVKFLNRWLAKKETGSEQHAVSEKIDDAE